MSASQLTSPPKPSFAHHIETLSLIIATGLKTGLLDESSCLLAYISVIVGIWAMDVVIILRDQDLERTDAARTDDLRGIRQEEDVEQ